MRIACFNIKRNHTIFFINYYIPYFLLKNKTKHHDILQKDGPAPEVMPGWLCEEVVARHLYSPSMLCLISWQDWMAMDEQLRNPDAVCERINVPANPHNNWNYRMHLSVEQLMTCEEQNNRIRQLIQRSGRNR